MKPLPVVLGVLLTLAGAFGSAEAQVSVQPPEVFVIEGRVAWITAQRSRTPVERGARVDDLAAGSRP